MTGNRMFALDVEGNGATPPEIVELSILPLDGRSAAGRASHWLLRPEKPITPIATRIHGLTDDDVRDAPSIEDIAGDLLEIMGSAPVVGHNVRVDLDALSRAIPDWRPSGAVDTLKLARALRPGLPAYALANLGTEFGLVDEATERSGGKPHSAPFDTMLCALLFAYLLNGLDEEAAARAIRGADILAEPKGTLL